MSIITSHISKTYKTQEVLKDLSFSVGEGEIVGFLGPNGAGKSTLMKVLTGYILPNKGSAKIAGIDVITSPKLVQKTLGYLPEHNPLYLDMYVKEYLHFVADMYALERPKEQVEKMLEKTGLTLEYKKQIGQLSKGYRQRVGLAQAMIHDPKVLLLDEPTTGLDPNQLHEIRNLIRNFGKDKTVLFSTHIMQEVTAICQRFIVLRKGELVADCSTQGLSPDDVEQKFMQLTR